MLTDNEIIELLGYKVKIQCDRCDIKDQECCKTCFFGLAKQSLDLINRQKAEIERLETRDHITQKMLKESWARIYELDKLNETAKNEIGQIRYDHYTDSFIRKEDEGK